MNRRAFIGMCAAAVGGVVAGITPGKPGTVPRFDVVGLDLGVSDYGNSVVIGVITREPGGLIRRYHTSAPFFDFHTEVEANEVIKRAMASLTAQLSGKDTTDG